MADVKISDAVPIETLDPTDMVPVARVGHVAPYKATMQEFANYVTLLASSTPPPTSSTEASAGTAIEYARADHVHPVNSAMAGLDSPELVGEPCAPTAPFHDSSDLIANTEFVMRELNSRVSTIVDSPLLIGTPRAPTAGIDDNTDIIATTQYVQNQASTEHPGMDSAGSAGVSTRWARGDHTHPVDLSRAAVTDIPQPADTLPTMDHTASPGVNFTWARSDHVHPSDESRYPITNPANYQTENQVTVTLQSFAYRDSPVLIGNPQAPTPVPTDSSASIATTAFVRVGTKTADTPPTGLIGEYLFAQVLQSAPGAITTGQTVNVTQLTLSAGDWGVSGNVGFAFTGGGATILACGINTVSAQIPIGGTSINRLQLGGNVTMPAADMPIPATRILLAAPAIIYLVASATFTGTGIVYGSMNARRSR